MSLKDFQLVSKLGQGAYSSVYKVRRLADDSIYALKRVKLQNLSQKQQDNALNQIRILASIKHPNVIGYKQAFYDQPSKSLCVVMQYAKNGDLSAKIQQLKLSGDSLCEQTIWSWFIQLVRGLKQLHDLKILHRDIKSANVFIHEDDTVKLGDMNVSKIAEQGLCVTQTGTPYYASPQVWKDLPYNQKSDIWSLGCVVYELITFTPPFAAEDMQSLYKKVIRGIYPKLPSQYSSDLASMVRCLLQVNPDLRPSCDKIIKMASIQKRVTPLTINPNQTNQLLRTIKAENFKSINNQLPKSNYQKKLQKMKSDRNNIKESLQFFNYRPEIDCLPHLDKEKTDYISANESSERHLQKSKKCLQLQRNRKKSQMSSCKIDIDGNRIMEDSKDLKLPKVLNRYNHLQDRLSKQKSLRCHNIF